MSLGKVRRKDSRREQPATRRQVSVRLGTCTLRFDHPRVMGIVNNTPDSFSGDGLGGDVQRAVELAQGMFEAGAAIVDIGGESTRPGASPVPINLELSRTVPVVEALSETHAGRISIDTMKPEVAQAALLAGAAIVNDVTGLRQKKMVEVVAEHDAAVIIMHMLGTPRTMQKRPRYGDVVDDVLGFLKKQVSVAETAGVRPNRIMVDPGIGFGKTLDHNLEILARLREFRSLGKPVVVGVSRKSFIGRITDKPVEQRLEGSLAAAVMAVREGADIVRAHDVPETVRALSVASDIMARRRM